MGRTRVELATDVLEDVRHSSPITTGLVPSPPPLGRRATGNIDRTQMHKRCVFDSTATIDTVPGTVGADSALKYNPCAKIEFDLRLSM